MKDKDTFYKTCDKFAFWAIFAFALECTFGCSGKWLSFGGFSIRMVLFTLCFLLTLPSVFRQLRTLIRSPYVILALVFAFYLVIAAVIGWKRGNNPQFIIADITGYLTLALLPGFIATINTKKRLFQLTEVLFYGAFALGLFTVLLHFYFKFAPDAHIHDFNHWINIHYLGGIGRLETSMHRIYFRSHIFLQVGLFLGIQKCWLAKGWKRWLLFAAEAVILFACLVSLTRGFWIGLVASAFFLLVLNPRQLVRYLLTVTAVAVFTGAIFGLSWAAYKQPVLITEIGNRLSPDMIDGAVIAEDPTEDTDPTDATDATTPEDTAPDSADPDEEKEEEKLSSVELRQQTLLQQKERIRQHPIFGSGLGANLDGLRDDGKTEYMYQDNLMKLGLIGFVLFLAVFFLPAIQIAIRAIRNLIQKNHISWDGPEMKNILLAVSLIGVGMTSYFNPFLTNPMGILLLLLTTAAITQTNKTISEEK